LRVAGARGANPLQYAMRNARLASREKHYAQVRYRRAGESVFRDLLKSVMNLNCLKQKFHKPKSAVTLQLAQNLLNYFA
jgi:hypothetical protein